jgi:hypothetical protein
MATLTAPKTMSPKQSAYIASLLELRRVPAGLAATYELDMTAVAASRLIDKLAKCPWKGDKPKAATAKATELVGEGFYCVGEAYYKVQTSKSSGKCYALVFNPATKKFEFAKGAIFKITAADKLTLEQAAKFGKKTGNCCICSKVLTKKESIRDGIGPICKGKMGW